MHVGEEGGFLMEEKRNKGQLHLKEIHYSWMQEKAALKIPSMGREAEIAQDNGV